ncbi:expressed unknown protein [Seminavis robusta]|uniref:SnoaL-like domain-containing protein n=1 Tax=Seminavis robusta TaxID=568900 RepID=A0A9N8DZQ2_9STRA|nr:expressed unknown protein [Seminavis robusta]|eukprot:Sro420_g139320.1 n/a (168) ;mRNA; r:35735-36238
MTASSLSEELRLKEARMENARRLMVVGKDDWEEVVDLWTDDAIYQEPSFTIQGKERLSYFLSNLFQFVKDDYKFVIEDEVYQGDTNTYMCYWRMSGSFQKEFLWNLIQFTETFDAKGMSIMKFRPGETRCYSHHDIYTEGDLWSKVIFIGDLVEYLRNEFRQTVTFK